MQRTVAEKPAMTGMYTFRPDMLEPKAEFYILVLRLVSKTWLITPST